MNQKQIPNCTISVHLKTAATMSSTYFYPYKRKRIGIIHHKQISRNTN